jgi:hypothetical protein
MSGASRHNDAWLECVICADAAVNICTEPCGHMVMCSGCADQLPTPACPLCRHAIVRKTVLPDDGPGRMPVLNVASPDSVRAFVRWWGTPQAACGRPEVMAWLANRCREHTAAEVRVWTLVVVAVAPVPRGCDAELALQYARLVACVAGSHSLQTEDAPEVFAVMHDLMQRFLNTPPVVCVLVNCWAIMAANPDNCEGMVAAIDPMVSLLGRDPEGMDCGPCLTLFWRLAKVQRLCVRLLAAARATQEYLAVHMGDDGTVCAGMKFLRRLHSRLRDSGVDNDLQAASAELACTALHVYGRVKAEDTPMPLSVAPALTLLDAVRRAADALPSIATTWRAAAVATAVAFKHSKKILLAGLRALGREYCFAPDYMAMTLELAGHVMDRHWMHRNAVLETMQRLVYMECTDRGVTRAFPATMQARLVATLLHFSEDAEVLRLGAKVFARPATDCNVVMEDLFDVFLRASRMNDDGLRVAILLVWSRAVIVAGLLDAPKWRAVAAALRRPLECPSQPVAGAAAALLQAMLHKYRLFEVNLELFKVAAACLQHDGILPESALQCVMCLRDVFPVDGPTAPALCAAAEAAVKQVLTGRFDDGFAREVLRFLVAVAGCRPDCRGLFGSAAKEFATQELRSRDPLSDAAQHARAFLKTLDEHTSAVRASILVAFRGFSSMEGLGV